MSQFDSQQEIQDILSHSYIDAPFTAAMRI